MMDYQAIIDKYYPKGTPLRHILMVHSRQVADRALLIADRHPELGIDRTFLEEAAMLHDIGIYLTDAPGIECHGSEPYILHGRLGAELMCREGYPRHARVCERHTGAGLTASEIEAQHLPLPHQDFLPETVEEKLVCYADKFYSKSHLDRVRTLQQTEQSIARHGEDGLRRFKQWEQMFE